MLTSLQLPEVKGHSRVSVQGEIVVQFDYSRMVQLLVYPVLPACVPGSKCQCMCVNGDETLKICRHMSGLLMVVLLLLLSPVLVELVDLYSCVTLLKQVKGLWENGK